MSRLLGRIRPEIVASGIFSDIHQQGAPLWATGTNAFFREGKVGPLPGYILVDTISGTPVISGIKELDNRVLSANGLIIGSRTNLYKWTSGAASSVGSGYGGTTDQSATAIASRWSIEQWGAWVVATDGVAVPQVYKGTSFAALGGVNFSTAEIFLRWRTYLLAFNLSTSKTDFKWCSDDDVETWTPSGVNSAGGLGVRDVSGPITAATYLGNNMVFFGSDSMHAVNWVEYPNYFGHQRLLKGIGCWGKLAVATMADGRLIGAGPRGVWTTDGTRVDYVDSPAVRTYIKTNLNVAQSSKVVVAYDLHSRIVYVFFPVNGSGSLEPTGGVAFNVESKQWTPLDFGRTVVSDGSVFGYNYFGTSAGLVRKVDTTVGSATFPNILLETKFTDLGDFGEDAEALVAGDKLIDQVRLEVGDTTLTNTVLYIGTKATWNGSATWSGPYAVSSLDAMIRARPPESRLVALRIVDATPLELWQLNGIQLYGEIVGGRNA